MSLRVAMIGDCADEPGAPASLLELPLRGRGDTVSRFPLDFEAQRVGSAAALLRFELAKVRRSFDLLVWCGGAGLGLLLGPVGKLLGAPSLLVLGSDHGPLTLLERAGVQLADQAIARDLRGYQALLAAGVPTYRAGLVTGAPDPAVFSAREAEPKSKERLQLLAILEGPATPEAASAIAAALSKQSKLFAEVWAPEPMISGLRQDFGALAARVEVSSPPAPRLRAQRLAAAHLVLSVGAPPEVLREAFAIGVGALAVAPDPAIAPGVEAVPLDRLAEVLGRTIKDQKLRQAAQDRARARDLETGYPAFERAWLRIVDRAAAP
ncbi:MAG: hypothetical protein U1E65_31110 [Myxococcota bacterium]